MGLFRHSGWQLHAATPDASCQLMAWLSARTPLHASQQIAGDDPCDPLAAASLLLSCGLLLLRRLRCRTPRASAPRCCTRSATSPSPWTTTPSSGWDGVGGGGGGAACGSRMRRLDQGGAYARTCLLAWCLAPHNPQRFHCNWTTARHLDRALPVLPMPATLAPCPKPRTAAAHTNPHSPTHPLLPIHPPATLAPLPSRAQQAVVGGGHRAAAGRVGDEARRVAQRRGAAVRRDALAHVQIRHR